MTPEVVQWCEDLSYTEDVIASHWDLEFESYPSGPRVRTCCDPSVESIFVRVGKELENTNLTAGFREICNDDL